jgi:hypothetical protein
MKIGLSTSVFESRHTVHHGHHVVAEREQLELSILGQTQSGALGGGPLRQVVVQLHGVQAREVAGTAGLPLLGAQGERVDVDGLVGDAGQVLVGLHQTEVGLGAHSETVGTVQHQLGILQQVQSLVGVGGTGASGRVVEPVVVRGTDGRRVILALQHPHQHLHGVVELHAGLLGGRQRIHRVRAVELHLLHQVRVGLRHEQLALGRVQEHVVNEELGVHDRGGRHELGHVRGQTGTIISQGHNQLLGRTQLHHQAHLVEAEGQQGNRQTRVAAEPELQGDVQDLRVVGVANQTQIRAHLTHHLAVAVLLLLRVRQLVPQVHPQTVVAINLLVTNLNVHVADQSMAQSVGPAHVNVLVRVEGHGHLRGGTEAGRAILVHEAGQLHLQVGLVHQIARTLHGRRGLLAEVRGTVHRLLNRLHREGRVTIVTRLEESGLGLRGQHRVLGAKGHKLNHTTTGHF